MAADAQQPVDDQAGRADGGADRRVVGAASRPPAARSAAAPSSWICGRPRRPAPRRRAGPAGPRRRARRRRYPRCPPEPRPGPRPPSRPGPRTPRPVRPRPAASARRAAAGPSGAAPPPGPWPPHGRFSSVSHHHREAHPGIVAQGHMPAAYPPLARRGGDACRRTASRGPPGGVLGDLDVGPAQPGRSAQRLGDRLLGREAAARDRAATRSLSVNSRAAGRGALRAASKRHVHDVHADAGDHPPSLSCAAPRRRARWRQAGRHPRSCAAGAAAAQWPGPAALASTAATSAATRQGRRSRPPSRTAR